MQQIDEAILKALQSFDSATIFNAVVKVRNSDDNEDYTGPELRFLNPGLGSFIGYAVTAEVTPLDPTPSDISWDDFYDYMNDTPGPIVSVMKDVDPRPIRAAIFGDGMAHLQKALGAVGAVCEGCVRDLPGISKAGLPIFGSGLVSGHGPFMMRRFGKPITVGQLPVKSGDLLFGDDDGVVNVPLDIVEEVVQAAEAVREREHGLFDIWKSPDFDYLKYKEYKNNL